MILIDGDVMAYKAAFGIGDSGSLEEIEEHIDEQFNYIFGDLLFTSDDPDPAGYQVYLSGPNNFRKELAVTQPYKGNRKKEKLHWLQDAREYLTDEWGAIVSDGCEVDDLIAIHATDLDYNCIIASVDKDFEQLPVEIYNPRTGQSKVIVEPNRNFYEQVLTGDRADNVEGIYGVGPKKAKVFLSGIPENDPKEMWEKVVAVYESYGETKERAIETAQLLWLWRKEGGTWSVPE